MARKQVLKQDLLVDKLRPDPSQSPSIERRGFLGKSDKEGYWRLYLTRGLTDYVEIADTDVVHQASLATRDDPDAGSRIWIKAVIAWNAVTASGPARSAHMRSTSTEALFWFAWPPEGSVRASNRKVTARMAPARQKYRIIRASLA